MEFNAEEYWSDKKTKKWVCDMGQNRQKIVAAKTHKKAKQSAIANSYHKKPSCYGCRLATPQDLSCKEIKIETLK